MIGLFKKRPEIEVKVGDKVEKVKLVSKSKAHAEALHQFLLSISERPEPPKER